MWAPGSSGFKLLRCTEARLLIQLNRLSLAINQSSCGAWYAYRLTVLRSSKAFGHTKHYSLTGIEGIISQQNKARRLTLCWANPLSSRFDVSTVTNSTVYLDTMTRKSFPGNQTLCNLIRRNRYQYSTIKRNS